LGLSVQTRPWQASASSSPPPRQAHVDVGSGDEGAGLAADEHHALDVGVLLQSVQQGVGLADKFSFQGVLALAGQVDGHHRDAVVADGQLKNSQIRFGCHGILVLGSLHRAPLSRWERGWG
jgi:hypothetical protein